MRSQSDLSQGPCETTLTERFKFSGCQCGTYEGNLGPCKSWEEGSNSRCVYCDHTLKCHNALIEEQRARVVEAALSWERTPYDHGAHLKGVACDCTFIADVYEEAGLIPHLSIESYSPQWHLNQREERYLSYVTPHAYEIAEPPLPGDIVLYKFGRVLSHAGIVIFPGWPRIVHAGLRERMVTRAEGDLGDFARAQVTRRYFTFWGVSTDRPPALQPLGTPGG
jgi:hypothetical protein